MKQDVNLKTKPQKPCSRRVLIMASGEGTNFEAIVKYFKARAAIEFELLCDKKEAKVLERAKSLGVRVYQVEFEKIYDFFKDKCKEEENASRNGKCPYDLIVLAGFMRVLPENVLKFGTFVNIHPSLLPHFKGKNAIQRSYEAKNGKTGITIHFATKKVDSGKIIFRKKISAKGLDLKGFEEKIHEAEHKFYPEAIEKLLFKKNVLILGGGAREHALAAKIKHSPYLGQLFLANPNDGFKKLGKTIEFTDFKDLAQKAGQNKIDLLVIGPENPLCEGVCDEFQKYKIPVIGANKDWARLEGSKIFAKEFMKRNGIETAEYWAISADEENFSEKIETEIKKFSAPPVIKADGLALGKGVLVPKTFEEAKNAAKEFLAGKFGAASKRILIENRLFGRELSVISLWDSKKLISFPPACDYKRLLENDEGPNTGGMGSFAPAEVDKEELENYLKKLENALRKEKANFTGIIYSGLISTKRGLEVLEYNMRFGDPETQALFELLDFDLLDLFLFATQKRLFEFDLFFKEKEAYCVVAAAKGYPKNPKKGAMIELPKEKNWCKIYFAGVKSSDKNGLETSGGRVLSVVNSGQDALNKIYETIEKIKYDGKIFRKDIKKR